MEYENGKVKAFFLQNDPTFEQFIAMIYQVLNLNLGEYSIIVKIVWGTNYPMQSIASLSMDILDDKMVNVIIHMNSDRINYSRTPIFVTTSPKVTIKAPLIPSQQNSTPLMPSTQSSAFKCTFGYGSMSNYGNYFFSDTEEQMFPTTESYSPFRDCDDVDCDHLLDDMEAMPQFQEDNDPRQNQPITPRSHSRIRPKYQL